MCSWKTHSALPVSLRFSGPWNITACNSVLRLRTSSYNRQTLIGIMSNAQPNQHEKRSRQIACLARNWSFRSVDQPSHCNSRAKHHNLTHTTVHIRHAEEFLWSKTRMCMKSEESIEPHNIQFRFEATMLLWPEGYLFRSVSFKFLSQQQKVVTKCHQLLLWLNTSQKWAPPS